MADREAGALGAEVIAVCEHYLGWPERRRGEIGAPEERAAWRCPECGGDFAAGEARAGCPNPRCPAPLDADALDLVAYFEGKRRDRDLLDLIRTVRKLVAARRAKVDRWARARARAQAEAEAERAGDPAARSEDGGTDGGTAGDGEVRRSPLGTSRQSEFEAWLKEKEREKEGEERRLGRERREAERREGAERHRTLADRTVAALAWATPRELAEALAVAVVVTAGAWVALTAAEGVYDFVAEMLGGGGIADYKVGHLEAGHLEGERHLRGLSITRTKTPAKRR